MNTQSGMLHRIGLPFFAAFALVLSAPIDASAQQVTYSEIEVKDKDGNYTDCGFQFVATLPEGYGLQGKAMYNQYTHLEFDVTAGKLAGNSLQTIKPQYVSLFVRGNQLQGKNSKPIVIYSNGHHIKKLSIPRTRVTYSLIDDMLPRGFNVYYIGADGTKLEVDLPPDRTFYGKYMAGCRAKMISAAQQNYQKRNKDAACWENPEQCRNKPKKN